MMRESKISKEIGIMIPDSLLLKMIAHLIRDSKSTYTGSIQAKELLKELKDYANYPEWEL